MKKTSLVMVGLFLAFGLTAQNSKRVGAWNGMNGYVRGDSDGDEQLVEAQKDIDEAATHETTSMEGKTWHYRGKIYYYLAKDEDLKMDYPKGLITAFESFEKALSLNDKKFKDGKETLEFMMSLSADLFNEGLEYYNNANYSMAYEYFYKINDVAKILEANDLESLANPVDAMNNAALAATNAKEYGKAIAIYEEQIAADPKNEEAFIRMANLYKVEGNEEKAKETIAKGLEENPNSMTLLTEDINFYLQDGKAVEAMDKIDKAVNLDPENASLQMVKGDVHVQLQEWDQGLEAYTKASELAPDDFRTFFNMGIIFTKQADMLVEEMNKLGFSDEEKKRYEELETQRKELFEQALPHIQKAAELAPDNDAVQRALKQVEGKVD